MLLTFAVLLPGCQSWLSDRFALEDDTSSSATDGVTMPPPVKFTSNQLTNDEANESKKASEVTQATATLAPKAPSEVRLASTFAPPGAMSVSPWGTTYVVPGEPSCSPEQLPVYETIFTPPGVVAPYGPYHGTVAGVPFSPPPAATNNGTGRAGWLDVLPQEGGPISPDFGLPKEAIVENRVANPLYLRSNNPEATWETLASELTKYFPIQTEQRIEQAAGVLTEGRFETPWQVGSTVLEPWKNDSVGSFNRWQSTLQTVRRKAIIRVIPAAGGYEIEARVEKQLEDIPRPERASAGAASFRNDSALPTDRLNPIDPIRTTDRWISIGRDEPLEQEMLRRFRSRLAGS